MDDINQKIFAKPQNYPYSKDYIYHTRLTHINLNKERDKDLRSGKGFIINSTLNIKKDINQEVGIFSSRYGSNMMDTNPYANNYRCKCGNLYGTINHGDICPYCKEKVVYRDDDISIFGYMNLNNMYTLISPSMYAAIKAFFGGDKLDKIITPAIQVDENGIQISEEDKKSRKKSDEPFRHIGMLEFRNRFDEIMDYYLKKYPNKIKAYERIMKDRECIFINTVAVFSSLLRPSRVENGSLKYEDTNTNYNMLNTLIPRINQTKLKINTRKKDKLTLLWEAQQEYNEIYEKVKQILAGKKGDFRSAAGGRCAFSARDVIRQDMSLRPNEIKLSFTNLCELLQFQIINILVRTYHDTYANAYKKWYKAKIEGSDVVVRDIIQGLIEVGDGLDVLINRNPTISYGSILKMKCVGINYDHSMSISLSVLDPLAGDFDGDTLNIFYLWNKEFIEVCEETFSPLVMFISKNDGRCYKGMLPYKDAIILINALRRLPNEYTDEEMDEIRDCMNS